MRILQLNFERGWRGGERQTLLCMRQFRDAGQQVSLLARRGGDLARRAGAEGFVVHEHASVASLCGFLMRRGREFDILHAQTANMMTWLALLKPLLGRRVVFTRRTAFPVRRRERQTAWKWGRADALVAISQAAAAEPRRLGLDVSVIPSAIEARPLDQGRLDAFARQFDLAGKRVLATAAALTAEKDPCTLIRAVRDLLDLRRDFVFLHLGAGGAAEAQARELVRELGLESHYLFTGFQAGIEDLYRLMDVFVLSSRQEALGTSVLDAFLYSVPVVATNAGGLRESLADGRGILCEVGDHQALALGMDKVLSDRGLRAGMVERAREYVLQEHDAKAMAGRYLAEYQRLLERAGRQGRPG
ncbi:glycosyltransferase family 4 protein [Pollutimonas bauzanensis]|uniref:Glycosyltransferase involved in cell wall bisynthesis n=1 Tax=Pollutimonas bauzanensis TaxID=658167 RepID=A0A1M5Y330_9BURK|nr:glycosyltransferase family 4 protein [Pollutimonas bauzanensis]SHI06412.1 Glycosyltransferase involved in cell wall bisynthesis [Pollutimonas bauzanensis]